jgi:hypothetical protein
MNNQSFTRLLYDPCNLQKKQQESTGPYDWVMQSGVKESQKRCFESSSPFQRNNFNSIPGNCIDIESNLRNQNTPLSRCPGKKYNGETACKMGTDQLCDGGICDCKECSNIDRLCTNDVEKELTPQFTKGRRACNVYSGVSINRFSPLCENPQDLHKIHPTGYIGINTRLLVADAYKKAGF